MPTQIQDNARVLFQGDSITDHGRSREDLSDLGSGYPLITAGWFSALYPQKRVTFVNRGISGNRVVDLLARWDADCIALQPTWVSILIGVNDMWRRYDSNDPTSVSDFEVNYRRLLETTVSRLNPKLILCEPFLLPVYEAQRSWREDIDPKIEVVRKLSREFNTILSRWTRCLRKQPNNEKPHTGCRTAYIPLRLAQRSSLKRGSKRLMLYNPCL